MPIPKIDPKKIFASQAPSQDVPAEFNNYERGWDESRKNNGKPTIKQFNKLQQLTDEKILWMHQNGAALPFDETMEYVEGAVVVKDGLIQQKSGASWVIPFMRGSQNLAELTDVAQARVKLDVYAKSEALSKNNNLSDVADKATARTNLGVYSKTETDSIATTPNATETVAGKAKIATTAIAQAGVNDTDFITAKKLAQTVLGMGQTRTQLTLVSGTTYTNTSGRLRFVSIYLINSPVYATLKLGMFSRNNIGASNTAGGGFYITFPWLNGEDLTFTYSQEFTAWVIS